MPTPETPPEARAVAESNGVNYYVLQDPNSTKIWSRIYENGWGRPEIVGEARESTPAAYVVYNQNSTKRAIFSLDSVSMLQTHEFDDEFADWEVGSKISAAHPQTSIAAVYDGQMLRVYYQDPEGNLRESVSGGYMEPWKPAEKPLPDVKVVPGTGLSATIIGGRVSLFYGNQDFSIHQLLYDNNDWTDSRIANTDDVMPLGRINATSTSGPTPEVNICFYTRMGELVELNVNRQERVKQGQLSDSGELIPESTKQFGVIGIFSAFFGFPLSFDLGSVRCWVCGGDVWIRAGTTSTAPCNCWGNHRRGGGNGNGNGRRAVSHDPHYRHFFPFVLPAHWFKLPTAVGMNAKSQIPKLKALKLQYFICIAYLPKYGSGRHRSFDLEPHIRLPRMILSTYQVHIRPRPEMRALQSHLT